MPNKKYLAGKGKENRVKKKYQLMGWVVLRSAGSKGFADLTAINTIENKIIFIQCKGKKFTEGQKKKLEDENKKYNGDFKVSYEVV